MKDKSSEGGIKCTITAQGSSIFFAQHFTYGGTYYTHQRKSYREK